MYIIQLIDEHLKSKGITRTHIANKTGIKKSKLTKLFNGYGHVYPGELFRILIVLGFKLVDEHNDIVIGEDPQSDFEDNYIVTKNTGNDNI